MEIFLDLNSLMMLWGLLVLSISSSSSLKGLATLNEEFAEIFKSAKTLGKRRRLLLMLRSGGFPHFFCPTMIVFVLVRLLLLWVSGSHVVNPPLTLPPALSLALVASRLSLFKGKDGIVCCICIFITSGETISLRYSPSELEEALRSSVLRIFLSNCITEHSRMHEELSELRSIMSVCIIFALASTWGSPTILWSCFSSISESSELISVSGASHSSSFSLIEIRSGVCCPLPLPLLQLDLFSLKFWLLQEPKLLVSSEICELSAVFQKSG
mmetsp:Transcript_3990/g.5552  ORF Transcript_3990/g.5552 Transcript_3990/m.5552 type:complete len:270 (+) Transcript_3990:2806-3615(+)